MGDSTKDVKSYADTSGGSVLVSNYGVYPTDVIIGTEKDRDARIRNLYDVKRVKMEELEDTLQASRKIVIETYTDAKARLDAADNKRKLKGVFNKDPRSQTTKLYRTHGCYLTEGEYTKNLRGIDVVQIFVCSDVFDACIPNFSDLCQYISLTITSMETEANTCDFYINAERKANGCVHIFNVYNGHAEDIGSKCRKTGFDGPSYFDTYVLFNESMDLAGIQEQQVFYVGVSIDSCPEDGEFEEL